MRLAAIIAAMAVLSASCGSAMAVGDGAAALEWCTALAFDDAAWQSNAAQQDYRADRACTDAIDSGGLSGTDLAKAYLARGEAHLKSKSADAAIADLDVALQTFPKDFDLLTDRGIAHTLAGQYDEALADFNAVIRLRPGFAPAYVGRGNVHLEQRDFGRAIADFDEAIRSNPADAEAYAARERAVRLKSRYGDSAVNNDQAKLDLEKAGDLRLGADRLWEKHLWQDAIEQYDEVIRLDPAIAEVYYRRGYAYAMRDKHDRAIADYDLAIALDPRNVATYLDRGNSLMHSGLYVRAAADFDEVVRHDPLPEVLYLRGLARFWSERYAEAARDLQKGRLRDPMSRDDDILWLYLARASSGVDGTIELKASADRIDRENADRLDRLNAYRALSRDLRLNTWPPLFPIPRDPVIRMYLGELTSDQVFDMVGGKVRSPRGPCRFHLFYAELLLSQPGDDRRRETASLQQALKVCNPNDLYYQFARSELKRLGQ